jgi:hypothetical protein
MTTAMLHVLARILVVTPLGGPPVTLVADPSRRYKSVRSSGK